MTFRTHPLLIVWLALGLCCCAPVAAETPDQIRNPKQTANVWVSDRAGVLDAAAERRLNARIDRLERQTSAEIAVVTIRRTDGRTPKQLATLLFNRWGVGKRSRNNGVLVLVVLDARRIEIETGRGMGRALPKSRVQRILNERVVPRFKKKDYQGGILAGVEALAQSIAPPPPAAGQPSFPKPRPAAPPVYPTEPMPGVTFPSASAPTTPPVPWAPLGVGVLLLGAGIGAYQSTRARRCPQCSQAMRLLDEAEDDALLDLGQRFEEELGSVDYRVWRCDRCQTSRVERAVRWLSGYGDCPRCHHRTVREHTDILRHPTYDWEGEALVTRACRLPGCGFLDREQRILPRRERPSQTVHAHHHHHHHHHDDASSSSISSSSSASDWSSSSSSSSDSSSSSSSSDSSSSSFGGGSSSRDGAGASW